MAENLVKLGISVTIIQALNQLLTTLDADMASFVHAQVRAHGIELRLGETVEGFRQDGDCVQTLLDNGNTLPSDMVLLAIGVTPDTHLAKDARKYRITTAIGKRNNTKVEELLYELIDSKTVLPCYNSTDPRVSLTDTKDFDSYKLYLSDTGLFITLMFIDRPVTENDIYAKLLSDKLPANLGYLYENLVAQMIAASGRELYYHTWGKKESTHYYEVDFLISEGSKINAFEIKSSGSGKHESIREFGKKFSQNINKTYLLSQKDVGKEENLLLKPFYLMPFLVK